MAGRGFRVKIELDLHAITCPGVWLCPNGKVALQINTLNSRIESHRIAPVFPLLFHDKFTFNRVFTDVATLAELQRSLERELVYTELVQWPSSFGGGVILATFETNLGDLLYPAPCFRGLLAGVDVDLLMEPTKCFPGILAPKIEVSTRTTIEETMGVRDASPAAARIVNPKMIRSKNPPCFHRKRPVKGIIRQRKVCHGRAKAGIQMCRRRKQCDSDSPSPDCCGSCPKGRRPKPESTDGAPSRSPCSTNRRSRSRSDRCYHAVDERPERTRPPPSTPSGSRDNSPAVRGDPHVFDNCPICFKYKCYFSCCCGARDTIGKRYDCKCKMKPPRVHERSEYNPPHSSPGKRGCSGTCRPCSAPSPREDPSTSLLRARMRQLQRAKTKLAPTGDDRGDDEDASERDPCWERGRDHGSGRQGFYKNLEKFYKRMYKQAKMRAQEVNRA